VGWEVVGEERAGVGWEVVVEEERGAAGLVVVEEERAEGGLVVGGEERAGVETAIATRWPVRGTARHQWPARPPVLQQAHPCY
jgi:hypothetical protein